MPAIVAFPTVVRGLLAQYADLFAIEPDRKHFAKYLTGLCIAERKTVSAINREFAVTTGQSCLNRWSAEVDWDEKALNGRRSVLSRWMARTGRPASGSQHSSLADLEPHL